jgi:hypothetical protein
MRAASAAFQSARNQTESLNELLKRAADVDARIEDAERKRAADRTAVAIWKDEATTPPRPVGAAASSIPENVIHPTNNDPILNAARLRAIIEQSYDTLHQIAGQRASHGLSLEQFRAAVGYQDLDNEQKESIDMPGRRDERYFRAEIAVEKKKIDCIKRVANDQSKSNKVLGRPRRD